MHASWRGQSRGRSSSPYLAGDVWLLYVDGASNIKGSRVGMVLASPNGIITEQALHFSFKTLNNKIEYEALLVELRLARELGVRHLKALRDSQSVVGQVRKEYEAKFPIMERYLKKIKELTPFFSPLRLYRYLGWRTLEWTSYQDWRSLSTQSP